MEIPKVFVHIGSGVTITSSAAFNKICAKDCPKCAFQSVPRELFGGLSQCSDEAFQANPTAWLEALAKEGYVVPGFVGPGEEEDLPSFNAADLGNLLE